MISACCRSRWAAYAAVAVGVAACPVIFGQTAPPSSTAGPSQRFIALTFDDLPMTVVGNDHVAGSLKESRAISDKLLKQLDAHHATAIGFVNEVKLNVQNERDARVALLESWLTAGMLLGNHGYSHQEFSEVGLAAYEDEFIRGDSITVDLLKEHRLSQRYFRHPYLDTGGNDGNKRKFEQFLNQRRYVIAPVTIQNEDWMFNAPYWRARQQESRPEADRVRAVYLAHTAAAFDYAEKLSNKTFGREIPQVMLLHANEINAENLDAVLQLMEKRGYKFISIDQVLADPAYRTEDNYAGPDGLSWLDRWQLSFGRPLHSEAPEPPKWVQDRYDAITGSNEGEQ